MRIKACAAAEIGTSRKKKIGNSFPTDSYTLLVGWSGIRRVIAAGNDLLESNSVRQAAEVCFNFRASVRSVSSCSWWLVVVLIRY